MSDFENVVEGKLRIKGKALDVKTNGINKKKKRKSSDHNQNKRSDLSADRNEDNTIEGGNGRQLGYLDYLTPAERRYMEQREKLEMKKLAKEAGRSHRDRIQEFNEYLANLSEHYDIPKVGPG